MKLRKKLITAVAMAAVCSTMAVPMVASASARIPVVGCPPHNFIKQNEEYSVTTTTHEYVYAYIIESDGTRTPLYSTCTVTTTVDQYDLLCTGCGMALIAQGSGTTTEHSSDCKKQ